jgi:hypothetical protein
MSNVTIKSKFAELYDVLNGIDDEHKPFKYSGRGMYGKQCIAIRLDSNSDLWEFAVELAQAEVFPGAPKTDSLGRGIVAYWPGIDWDESQANSNEEEEGEE